MSPICPKVSITCLPLYLLGSHKSKWLTLSFSILPILTVLTDLFILYNLIFFLAFSQKYALEGHQTSLKYQIKWLSLKPSFPDLCVKGVPFIHGLFPRTLSHLWLPFTSHWPMAFSAGTLRPPLLQSRVIKSAGKKEERCQVLHHLSFVFCWALGQRKEENIV